MTGDLTVEIKGLESISRAFEQIGAKMRGKKMKEILDAAATPLWQNMIAYAPISTTSDHPGRLKGSIAKRKAWVREFAMGIYVGTDAAAYIGQGFYGSFLEYGYQMGRLRVSRSARGSTGDTRIRVPAKPWARPAILAAQNACVELLRSGVARLVEGAAQ